MADAQQLGWNMIRRLCRWNSTCFRKTECMWIQNHEAERLIRWLCILQKDLSKWLLNGQVPWDSWKVAPVRANQTAIAHSCSGAQLLREWELQCWRAPLDAGSFRGWTKQPPSPAKPSRTSRSCCLNSQRCPTNTRRTCPKMGKDGENPHWNGCQRTEQGRKEPEEKREEERAKQQPLPVRGTVCPELRKHQTCFISLRSQ